MRLENPSKVRDWNPPENHHGFVYVYVGKDEGVPLWELRKPTPDERIWIVENYIRRHSNQVIKISFLASKLGVSDRTIQTILRDLESNGTIGSKASIDELNRQTGNVYWWTGNDDPIIGSPTLEDLYKKKDGYGFRSFTWDDFKMYESEDWLDRVDQYFQYIELLDIKKRLKRKRDRRYKLCLRSLRKLNVRDKDENLV
ncbi:MAG: HTH domain-containing protein [Bacilli bacterium]